MMKMLPICDGFASARRSFRRARKHARKKYTTPQNHFCEKKGRPHSFH